MSSSNSVRVTYIPEATYGTTPAGVKALLIVQDLTYTAVKAGTQGNSISIEYLDTGTAGAEVVTVTSNKISVSMEDGASTATQIHTAILASPAAVALVTCIISGTGATAQIAAANTVLATGTGEFYTARFTSEALSGSPETTESQQIRTDRQSSGQVVTGLKVGGNLNFELAKESPVDDFIKSAMLGSWDTTSITETGTLALDASAQTIVKTGNWADLGLVVGDFLKLTNFADAGNNVYVMIASLSTTTLTYSGPTGMVTATESATFARAAKISIGTTKYSFSMEKAFTDLTTKAINYKGMIVNQMNIDVKYGSLVSGSFGFLGNSYAVASSAATFETYLKYITSAATTNTVNGSVDMPFLSTNASGTFSTSGLCIQSLTMTLDNNLTPQTCIGTAAPEAYTPGTASVKVSLSAYLKDATWSLLANKLSQASFAIGFPVYNSDGGYGFYMPAVQVSFDDPAAGGANQDISMNMSGIAKVGSGGLSALSIYKIV